MPTYHFHARTLLMIARDAARRAQVDAARPNALTSDAILAVTMSAAAAEAFINEFAQYAPAAFSTVGDEGVPAAIAACAQILEDLEGSRAAVTAKYLMGSYALCGKAFATGAPPFQDFKLLVDLRNAIMHMKVNVEGDPNPGARVTDVLAQRRIAISGKDPGSLPWFDRLMTPETASWAHDTAITMIRSFLELVPVRGHWDPLQFYRDSFRHHPGVDSNS